MAFGKSFLRAWVSDDTPADLLGESAWVYLLSRNYIASFFGVDTVVMQWMILRAFAIHSEINLFATNCNDDGMPICKGWEMSLGTILLVDFILLFWTLADIMTGLQFLISAVMFHNPFHKRFRLFLTGLVALTVPTGTYIYAFRNIYYGATSDLEALFNVVGILYVMDIDEAVYASIWKLAPHWHKRQLENMRNEYVLGLNGKGGSEEEEEVNGQGSDDKVSIRTKTLIRDEETAETTPTARRPPRPNSLSSSSTPSTTRNHNSSINNINRNNNESISQSETNNKAAVFESQKRGLNTSTTSRDSEGVGVGEKRGPPPASKQTNQQLSNSKNSIKSNDNNGRTRPVAPARGSNKN